MLCNLCGNVMADTEAHSFFEPLGEICEECTQDIKEFGTSRILLDETEKENN